MLASVVLMEADDDFGLDVIEIITLPRSQAFLSMLIPKTQVTLEKLWLTLLMKIKLGLLCWEIPSCWYHPGKNAKARSA